MGFFHALVARWTEPYELALQGDGLPEAGIGFGDLDRRARAAAALLRARGLGPGDVLALQLHRCPELLELHLGALALGVVTLPLNPQYTDAEVRWYLADAGVRLAVLLEPDSAGGVPCLGAASVRQALDEARPLAWEELTEPAPEDLACLLYTSGTTGRPKGAMITHGNLQATVEALHEAWRWSRHDHLLHALPLFHVHGLFVAQHGALWAGATTTWMARFEAQRALRLLEERGCTVFMGVPTFYHRLLSLPPEHTVSLPDMRLFTSGSAALPATDHRAFQARFGHVVLERYGMTEVGIVLSNPYEGERRPGAVGFPLPGVEARVVKPETGEACGGDEVGELQIKGASVFAGYLGRPEQTREALGTDGWMRTGDLAQVDADGYIHLVGRSKDLVITGGLNVYPREVEGVLLEVPGVAEVAIVGVPDPEWGERVVGLVVPVTGARLDPTALIAACRGRLAPYKCPRELRLAPELPRNAMGKVQKHRVREAW